MRCAKSSVAIIVLLAAHAISAPVSLGFGTERPTERAQTDSVVIHVTKAYVKCSHGISFDWEIQNVGNQTIYVYAPFLSGPSAEPLAATKRADVTSIVVSTSLRSEVSFPPYSYPDPSFKRLQTGKTLKGKFSEPIQRELSCSSLVRSEVIYEVAWVTDPHTVDLEAMRIKKEGKEHPGNAIVRAAHVAKSGPIPLEYTQAE